MAMARDYHYIQQLPQPGIATVIDYYSQGPLQTGTLMAKGPYNQGATAMQRQLKAEITGYPVL
jgi:hypothetical protein